MSELRLGEVDFKKKPVKLELFLCKPNKEIISKLNESYNETLSLKLGALNELNFNLPQFVERKHMITRNIHADIIKGRYLIRALLGTYEEYFIINNIQKDGADEETLTISTLSLGYQLNDKIIRDYNEVSKNATEQLNDILKDTDWSIGYIDSEFDMKRRALEVSSSTVLELVFDIAKTFNALAVWDTLLKKVSFYKPDNVGLDRGFKIKYGKYLESLNQEDNTEEVVTRLKMYGKEDLTIRELNPLGTTYIEDLTFFIFPFKRDTYRNVISHSDYMSDELCHALLDYQDLIDANSSRFETLRAMKSVHQENLYAKQRELFDLQTDQKIKLDERDILNTKIAKKSDKIEEADNKNESSLDYQMELNTLKIELDAKNQEIEDITLLLNLKSSEIVVVESDIAVVDSDLNTLRNILSVEANFTTDLIKERKQFIIEKEWQDSNIELAEDLLKEGKEVFEELKRQKITLKIDIVNFLGMITEQRNHDKLNLGDTFGIEYERLNVKYEAKLTEIEYDFEGDSISIVISNVKDTQNKDKFLDMLYKSYGTSAQVSFDKWKWDLSLENKGSINELINNIWDANKQAIIGAKDQVVEISDRGLLIRDPNDPNTYLVGLNAMIAITNDGGNTFKHAITSNGIVGERVYGKVIMGVNLAIEDEDGVLKFQGSKGEIFDRDGNLVMKLGLIEESPDSFGLTSFNDVTRVTMSDRLGFAIEQVNPTMVNGWEKVFWADPFDGTIYSKNLVAQNLKIVNNVGEKILDAETDFFDIGAFKTIVADGKLTTLEKLQVAKELNRVYSGFKLLEAQAKKYQTVHRDDIVNTNSQFLSSKPSTIDKFSITPLRDKYIALVEYMKSYISITSLNPHDPLTMNLGDKLMEETSAIADRAVFILKFKEYYDEADILRNRIQDAIYYTGINMGEFYNNITIGEYGFIALRNDGKYRAFMNATNGLALQKWENSMWVNKVYASIGNSEYEDGTLIAEDLVAKRLTIRTKDDRVLLDADSLVMDLSALDSLVSDDVIVSVEKSTLLNQFKNVTKQYTGITAQATKYSTEVYSDRDSKYLKLDEVKDALIASNLELSNKYRELESYLAPIFVDMNAVTHVVKDLSSSRTEFNAKWESFYNAYEKCRSALENFLEASSLQLGRLYNTTVIDAENGITVTRKDGLFRSTLNATSGLSLQKKEGDKWLDMLYANVDGSLTIRNLKILNDSDKESLTIDKNGKVTINTYSDDGKSTTILKGGYIEAKGTYSRVWDTFFNGTQTDTSTVALRFENGYIRARNSTLDRSLYISDFGLSTMIDGSGSGSIEFFSTVYSNTKGLTLSAQGVLGLTSYQSYINLSPEWNNRGNNTFSFQILDGDTTSETDGLLLYGSHTVGYGSGIRMDKVKPYVYITNGGATRGTGTLIAKSIESHSEQTLTLKVNNNNYIEISSSGIKIKGSRIDLN